MLAKGTLVRVLPSALLPASSHAPANNTHVQKHGMLWAVMGGTETSPLLYCKSLATGAMAIWRDYEVEAHDGAENE